MSYSLPISPSYRTPIFEAVTLQVILGILSLMVLDFGETARICGVTLIAFWIGASVVIWHRPKSPTKTDILLIRFGFLPLVVLAGFLIHFIWHLRGAA